MKLLSFWQRYGWVIVVVALGAMLLYASFTSKVQYQNQQNKRAIRLSEQQARAAQQQVTVADSARQQLLRQALYWQAQAAASQQLQYHNDSLYYEERLRLARASAAELQQFLATYQPRR